MKRLATIVGLGLALVVGAPVGAITFGELDGDGHPWVGALIAPWREGGALDEWCSGTLVAPTVFVTASHCTAGLAARDIGPDDVFVTFDSAFSLAGNLIPGHYVTNPEYGFSGQGGHSDPHDVAVVLLAWAPPGVTPAQLPTHAYLDSLDLRDQRFTAVGYGTVREDKTKGFQTLFWDPQRRWADQGFMSITRAWLNLSMNPSTGNGGTCYGDSGGPHFVGTSNLVVSLTVTGDAPCRATDVTYRLDTDSARSFLGQFVTLP